MFNRTFENRFWSKVKKTDACWLWEASTTTRGYGQISRDSDGNMIKAHRASYIMAYGEISEGLQVCHSCDIPTCVRPDHLFLGTCADNLKDRNNKNRQAKGEVLGSSKLKEKDINTIRETYSLGSKTMQEIALDYGVCNATVWNVINNKTWKHVRKHNAR